MSQIELTSIGQFASEQGKSVQFIREVADRLGIVPDVVLDRVPHYSERDLDRIAQAMRRHELTKRIAF